MLLGRLLHEELALRWEQLLLDEAFTGGALAWLPGRTARVGQLVYPSGGALDKLCILSRLVGILRPSTVIQGKCEMGDQSPILNQGLRFPGGQCELKWQSPGL